MVDDQQHLLAALERLNETIGSGMARRLGSLGVELRASQGRILSLIADEGTRPTELAAGAWISKQAIGKRVQDLADRGLVVLTPDPADRRAVLVRRTSDGDRVLALVSQQIEDLEHELAARVGEHRYRQFRKVLDELGTPR
jgi:DNA-binding MarR family transcriptional regulator